MASVEPTVSSNALQRTLLWLLRPLLQVRSRHIARVLMKHLKPGDRVLDVGCGSLAVGKMITSRMDVEWVAIDVVDYCEPGLEFHLYDGKRIPFEDGAFDVVLLAFVLHHCEDLLEVFQESCRVSRERLLILEDLVDGSIQSLVVTKLHDWIANGLLYSGIPLPYRFNTLREWEEIMRQAELEIVALEPLRTHPLAFIDQRLFVARKAR